MAHIRMEDLGRLRISLRRALPFIVVADHTPRSLTDSLDLRQRVVGRNQLDLFATARSARWRDLIGNLVASRFDVLLIE